MLIEEMMADIELLKSRPDNSNVSVKVTTVMKYTKMNASTAYTMRLGTTWLPIRMGSTACGCRTSACSATCT